MPKPGASESTSKRSPLVLLGGGLIVLVVVVLVAGAIFGGADKDGVAASPSPLVRPSPPTNICENASPTSIPGRTARDKPYPMTIDTKATYKAQLTTSCGTMLVKLFPKEAPQAVNNFVNLAKDGFYYGQIFHSIDRETGLIATGDPACPSGNDVCGGGGPGYMLPFERTGLDSKAGTVALGLPPEGDPGESAGSVFVIAANETGAGNIAPGNVIFGQLVGEHSRRVAELILTLPTKVAPNAPAGAPADYPAREYVYLTDIKIQGPKGDR